MLRVGYHVAHGKSLAKSMQKASNLLIDMGFDPYLQIFVCGPRSHTFINLGDKKDIAIIRSIPHVIHSAYVSHPWNNAPGTIHTLGLEFKVSTKINSDGVVVHMGSGIFDDKILNSVASHIDNKRSSNSKLWLEISACKPDSANAFDTPQKINDAIRECKRHHISVGLVIDTAHLYAMGVSFTYAKPTLAWLSQLIPVDIIFHLNDTIGKLGDGKDIHASIISPKSNIWGVFHKKSKLYTLDIHDSGLAAIIKFAHKRDCPIILERHDNVYGELEFIASLL